MCRAPDHICCAGRVHCLQQPERSQPEAGAHPLSVAAPALPKPILQCRVWAAHLFLLLVLQSAALPSVPRCPALYSLVFCWLPTPAAGKAVLWPSYSQRCCKGAPHMTFASPHSSRFVCCTLHARRSHARASAPLTPCTGFPGLASRPPAELGLYKSEGVTPGLATVIVGQGFASRRISKSMGAGLGVAGLEKGRKSGADRKSEATERRKDAGKVWDGYIT